MCDSLDLEYLPKPYELKSHHPLEWYYQKMVEIKWWGLDAGLWLLRLCPLGLYCDSNSLSYSLIYVLIYLLHLKCEVTFIFCHALPL